MSQTFVFEALNKGRKILADQQAEAEAERQREKEADDANWEALVKAAQADVGAFKDFLQLDRPDRFGRETRSHTFHLCVPSVGVVARQYFAHGSHVDGKTEYEWKPTCYMNQSNQWAAVTYQVWYEGDLQCLSPGGERDWRWCSTFEEALAQAEVQRREFEKLSENVLAANARTKERQERRVAQPREKTKAEVLVEALAAFIEDYVPAEC